MRPLAWLMCRKRRKRRGRQSPDTDPRSAFTAPRRVLESTRLAFWPAETRVATRRFGFSAASATIETSRSIASARLSACVRRDCAVMTITPSLVSLEPASRISRIATSFGSEGERRASKRSWAAVETLLMFCYINFSRGLFVGANFLPLGFDRRRAALSFKPPFL